MKNGCHGIKIRYGFNSMAFFVSWEIPKELHMKQKELCVEAHSCLDVRKMFFLNLI